MSDAMTDMRNNKKLRDKIESLRQQLASRDAELERQIMSSLVPKNEREHLACGEIESLRQQLADSQKQVTLLRDALKHMRSEYERYACVACDEADEALAATADLDGLILCHAEPCRDDGRCQYAIDHGAEGLGHCPEGKCCMPLYRAREPK